jgi:hypothetical protein
MHLVRLVLVLELAFAMLALLVLARGLLLGSRDSACLLAALALVLQGARLGVEHITGGALSFACQAEQTQNDGPRLKVAGRCERDGRGDSRHSGRESGALASYAGGDVGEQFHAWRCMLCGQEGPGAQEASAASSPCPSSLDDGFKSCVLCSSARESQRAAARAHEVRAQWRLPQSPVRPAFAVLQAGITDEVARASSPGPSRVTPPPPDAPEADQGRRGQGALNGRTPTVMEPVRLGADVTIADNVGMTPVQIAAHRMATYSDQADLARRLEAAEGTLAMMAVMAARRYGLS